MTVTFISLEGSIGAGKSTLVKAIEDLGRDDVIVIQEPVSLWTARNIEQSDGSRTSLLESYYKDQRGVALAFQMYAMLTRVQQLLDVQLSENKRTLVVAERCCWSDYELFGKPMYDCGLLSPADWFVYTEWFKAVTSSRLAPPLKPSGYVFLNCPPEKCMERIGVRARQGEDGIDLPYLKSLHDAHLRFLETKKEEEVAVMEIDGSAAEAIQITAERIVTWGLELIP